MAEARITPLIGTLNEKPLHAALKRWYARDGDRVEVAVGGYLVDIERDGVLIEIQTGGFAPLRRKLRALIERHPVRLVCPIAVERWLVSRSPHGGAVRRKSPKRGRVEDVFVPLVSVPELLAHPNLSLEVLLIQEEVARCSDGRRRRGREWRVEERRLLGVVEQRRFDTPRELAALVPESLAEPFLTRDLAGALRRPLWLAQKMAYCLREMGVLVAVGKRGNAIAYARVGREAAGGAHSVA